MKTVGLDAPRVTADEAVELCIHHLQLAAMYFEATPDDTEQLLTEARRIMLREVPSYDTPGYHAAVVWIADIAATYNQMKDDD